MSYQNINDIEKFLKHVDEIRYDRKKIESSKNRINDPKTFKKFLEYHSHRGYIGVVRLTNLIKNIRIWGNRKDSTAMGYSIILDDEDLTYLFDKYSKLLPELKKKAKQKELDQLIESSNQNNRRIEQLKKEINGE